MPHGAGRRVVTRNLSSPEFIDQDYPADPYPGARPSTSFVHLDAAGYALTSDEALPSGWRLGDHPGRDLDAELSAIGEPLLAERMPVLAYGSNANPSKITWLREELGLEGPVVVIRASCRDVAAVWSAGTRERDGQRPAVISASPGTVEHHAVWLATPEQRRVLDEVGGRGERYRLAWVHTPVRFEGGRDLRSVLAYTARPEAIGQDVPLHLNRSPLLVDGRPVKCAELWQDRALRLEGEPADSDGLVATEVHGDP